MRGVKIGDVVTAVAKVGPEIITTKFKIDRIEDWGFEGIVLDGEYVSNDRYACSWNISEKWGAVWHEDGVKVDLRRPATAQSVQESIRRIYEANPIPRAPIVSTKALALALFETDPRVNALVARHTEPNGIPRADLIARAWKVEVGIRRECEERAAAMQKHL